MAGGSSTPGDAVRGGRDLAAVLRLRLPTFLLAALGVGIAGGSFAVGIAYVSRWYPKEKQGTALGIFGAGNVGAAVTKFLAPMVMVALAGRWSRRSGRSACW
jgi:nitrate/nitrite transporter NarK